VRSILVVLLLVAAAPAQGRHAPTPEQVDEVRRIIGEKDWGLMAEWRRHDVVHRYLRFLDAPENKREAIRAAGLKEFLTAAPKRRGPPLPQELQAAVDRVNPELRGTAHKLAFVRLRQLRFDRNLELLPISTRRQWFERLFPEPFDRRGARDARIEFDKEVARAIARRLRPRVEQMADMPEAERKRAVGELVRRYAQEQEQELLRAVTRSVEALAGESAEREGRGLPPELELLLERDEVFATPRQRELIRWALHPEDCPILDLSWMGPPPDDKRARREWERDRTTLARIDLLLEAGFPRDHVLHLAAAGSDQGFVRALRHIAGRPPPEPRAKPPQR